jgi:NAD(P)-dependent dehydrogenase (short-subunit alcohol dehydrogenase family)
LLPTSDGGNTGGNTCRVTLFSGATHPSTGVHAGSSSREDRSGGKDRSCHRFDQRHRACHRHTGIFEPKDVFDISDDDWRRFFEVNVLSGMRLSRIYLKGMLARDWGRIVFVSSESALNIPKEMIHYGTSKTAQLAVARGLAKLTAGTGVTVNSILPGPTRSEGVEEFLKAMAAESGQGVEQAAASFIKQHRSSSLLQRFASVEEVANMAVYISSREASATNGAALRVEGGIVDTIA